MSTIINYKYEELIRIMLKLLHFNGNTHRLVSIVELTQELPLNIDYIDFSSYSPGDDFIQAFESNLNTTLDGLKLPDDFELPEYFRTSVVTLEPLYSFNDIRQKQFIYSYSEMAKVWSQNSYCVRRQVGALIVKDKMIISDGFNGTPSGFENCCEIEFPAGEHNVLKTRPEVLHAESNAITKCAKYGRSTDGADLYITCSPCLECSKLIIQSGIKRVFFSDLYKDASGLLLLLKSGIEIYYIPSHN